MFFRLGSNTKLRHRNSTIHPLVGQEGTLVMTQEKINTVTGCPRGRERGLSTEAEVSGGEAVLAPALLFGLRSAGTT